MLLEVIQAGPFLVRPWAILAKTQIHHLRTAFRLLVMDTFLMASQVVDGAEALLASTVGLVAFEEFLVACIMFSVKAVSTCPMVGVQTGLPLVGRTLSNP